MSAGDSSVIVRGVRAIGRAFDSLDKGLARAAAERNADADADAGRVRAIIADSRVVRFVESLFAAPAVAWRHSKARDLTLAAARTLDALELPQRVRVFGWMIVVAVVTRAAIFVLLGNTPSLATLGFWGVIAGTGIFMMVAARSVAAAWIDWRQRRS